VSPCHLQVAALGLFSLDSLKQTLEITRTKPIKVVPLDDLDKDGWSVHQRLQKVSMNNPLYVLA
jgi:hypothetical protein